MVRFCHSLHCTAADGGCVMTLRVTEILGGGRGRRKMRDGRGRRREREYCLNAVLSSMARHGKYKRLTKYKL